MTILQRPSFQIIAIVFFSVSLAQAAAEKTLYEFGAPGGQDGMQPFCVPVLDANGNLFGTTMLGGPDNAGTIFELSRNASNQWVETILHEFTGASDGGYPVAGLVFDNQGNLYGTAGGGGTNGTGVVFELSPQGSGWSYSVIYSFGAYLKTNDGFAPNSPVVFDSAGNMYGTTNEGGGAGCFNGCGTVFELSPTGTGRWTEQVIHHFSANPPDGQLPSGGLALDKNGDLYGTTPNGGTSGGGVLYQLKYSSTTKMWSETIVHQFGVNTGDGADPINVILLAGQDGNLYGTTDGGGKNGHGAVFETTFSKTGAKTSILYSFKETYSGDGNAPHSGVIMDKEGNLYGTTSYGGAFNYYGTIFRLSKSSGGEWNETVLYSFTGGSDGYYPQAGVTMSNGFLYGTTWLGGNNSGVVYESAR
jgi:uncharacterized repeat protein (TIGR03803 family)